jgi:molybdate-binding protein/DNA-binding XRE family transcriptional regulator
VGEQMVYRFPLPGQKLKDMTFSLQTESTVCKDPHMVPEAKPETKNDRTTFTRTWSEEKPKGEIVFACTPADPRVQGICGKQGDNGSYYVYARLRPNLPAVEKGEPFASHAVFLLDTSLSEHPDRFAVSMKLLRRVLEDDADIKDFNILAFNVGASWVSADGWLPNTAAGRETAMSRLDGLVLEGATDVSRALDLLAKPGWTVPAGTNVNCFLLSDGNFNWGETQIAPLVARFSERCPFNCRFHCYRIGLGAENLELYEALTRKGGGIFNCFGDADVKAAAQAHRNHCLQVERVCIAGKVWSEDFLVAGRQAAVYPGGELIVAAKLGSGHAWIVVEGIFRGQKVRQEFDLNATGSSELAPRAWAEVAVASLLALNDPKLDELVTAYCQQFGIASRVASFLVLEKDDDYKRLNLDEERGKTVPGDMGEYLDKAWAALGKMMTARESFAHFLDRVDGHVKLLQGDNGPHVRKLVDLLSDKDFDLPTGELHGGLTKRKDVSSEYLDGRKKDRREVNTYLAEARRRAAAGDVDGAVCALSSVIEEHPGRSDALRLVGYRLLDMQQPGQAARLFEQVRNQRPFEPHSYRDLAHSLEDSGLYGLAAVYYEIVLAGTGHTRFHGELALVAREEYVRMMQEAVRKGAVSKALADHFGERLEKLKEAQKPADLRVTISWNTDATDIDLWVIEPDGEKCFYQHKNTKSGGELSADQTQGYGPERYQIAKASVGTYKVLVHYFRNNLALRANTNPFAYAMIVSYHDTIMDTPSNRVRAYRQERGWSQADLATRAGISRAAVSAIEINRLVPSVAAGLALAAALACTVEDLFGLAAIGSADGPQWAWVPERCPCRYWEAQAQGRTLRYPAEATAAGLVPHDGVFRDGRCSTRGTADPAATLVLASCDPAAGLLAAEYSRLTAFRLIVLPRSSRQALTLLGEGLIHAAGLHFATPDDPEGNRRVVAAALATEYRLLRVARWEEGLVLRPATGVRSVRGALRSRLRWVGREPGSAARQCLDELFGGRPSPRHTAHDHRGVAEAVRSGWADVGLCHRLVGEEAGLQFVAVRLEDFDLCYPATLHADPRLLALVRVVRSDSYRRLLGELPGCDITAAGELLTNT